MSCAYLFRKNNLSKHESIKKNIEENQGFENHSIKNGYDVSLEDYEEVFEVMDVAHREQQAAGTLEDAQHISQQQQRPTNKPSHNNRNTSSDSTRMTVSPKSMTHESSSQNWYPLHMSKARSAIHEKHTDCFIQLLDARCPLTSFNPSILGDVVNQKKPVFSVAYKRDLAVLKGIHKGLEGLLDTKLVWLDHKATNRELNRFLNHVEKKVPRKFKTIPVVSCIVGVPNVGKSSFINVLAKKHKAKKGDLPGVTKRISGFNVTDQLMVLDTPGILMPQISTYEERMKLMLINAISEKLVDYSELATFGMKLLDRKGFSEGYLKSYGVQYTHHPMQVLEQIAHKFSFRNGDTLNVDRAAEHWVRRFRSGEFGKVFLDDLPEDIMNASRAFSSVSSDSFLNNVHHLSDWYTYHIEHVYIDAEPFAYMSKYACTMKLLKQHDEANTLLIDLCKHFVQEAQLKRVNIIFPKIPKHLKKKKREEQIAIRDRGDHASVHDHLINLRNLLDSDTLERRLFVTNNETTAKQLLTRGCRVVHIGEWLEWMSRVLYNGISVERMLKHVHQS